MPVRSAFVRREQKAGNEFRADRYYVSGLTSPSRSIAGIGYRRANFRPDDAIDPPLATSVTCLKIGEKSYFDLISPPGPVEESGTRERGWRTERGRDRDGASAGRTGGRARSRAREGARNDYLSFKTNSQVSAKSSANQRVEGGGIEEAAQRNRSTGRRRSRGEIIC